jgi:hypothetical protein
MNKIQKKIGYCLKREDYWSGQINHGDFVTKNKF